jgi:TonB family protein
MTAAALAAMLWALSPQQASVTPGAASDLAAARALYAAGNYEDALNRLPSTPGDANVGEVDEYRALCLLALGRSDEAEHSLEDLVSRQPMFKMSDTDISPRLITMFRDTRKRLLPGAARDLYAKAKTDYEHQEYAKASPEFKELLELLGDEDLADSTSTVSDLKLLAEGFSKLADSEAAAAAKAAATQTQTPPPPTAPAAASDSGSAVPPTSSPATSPDPGGKVYTADDSGVDPPVAVSTPYPTWHPPTAVAKREYQGLLRIVIDATGRVESAVMVVSVTSDYDPLLLAAAKDWTFKPAQVAGASVRYQKQIAVTLSPR